MNDAILKPQDSQEDRCWVAQGVWGNKTCDRLSDLYHCSYCPKYKTAAASLLNQPISEIHLSERTEYYRRPRISSQIQTGSLLVFRLGKEWFGIPPRYIQEVTAQRKIHSIPHRKIGILRGVANIRGELLLCVSLADFLGIEMDEKSEKKSKLGSRWLVISHERHRLVIPTSEVQDIIPFSESELQMPPSTLGKGTIHFTRGLVLWQKNWVGCLDMQELFSALIQHLS